ncbi:MAG: hypothetical protein OXG04_19770 [Acidobacteria bacterium]|nr:hypothetical protein [Acidobacteriota bacterium]
MAYDAAALQRFSLKIFAEPASAGVPSTIIPVFHRWIQEGAVPGLLIDVADYTHLVDGPSVLLIAHEANYALDETGGRPGLSYTRKQPLEGTFGERLAVAAAALIAAARRLEHDTSRMTGGGIVFPGNEIAFAANDRLAAPRTADTETALRDALVAFGGRLFGGSNVEVQPLDDPARLGLTVKTVGAVPLATLLSRVE